MVSILTDQLTIGVMAVAWKEKRRPSQSLQAYSKSNDITRHGNGLKLKIRLTS